MLHAPHYNYFSFFITNYLQLIPWILSDPSFKGIPDHCHTSKMVLLNWPSNKGFQLILYHNPKLLVIRSCQNRWPDFPENRDD